MTSSPFQFLRYGLSLLFVAVAVGLFFFFIAFLFIAEKISGRDYGKMLLG